MPVTSFAQVWCTTSEDVTRVGRPVGAGRGVTGGDRCGAPHPGDRPRLPAVTVIGDTGRMEDRTPAVLRAGARSRVPLEDDMLVELSADERMVARAGELDRATGSIDMPLAPDCVEPMPPKGTPRLPPTVDATGGTLRLGRRAWLAKYRPSRAADAGTVGAAGRQVAYSDVIADYPWGDTREALRTRWITSDLLRGAGKQLPIVQPGDLVFVMRTDFAPVDVGMLRRPTIVGVWWFESRIDWWDVTFPSGRTRWVSEGVCFPLRRFDFPVPTEATGAADAAFFRIGALRDRSQQAFMPLSAAETVAMARACGLPAVALTEPDPDRLAVALRDVDLGPPTHVRQRILDGARASAHRRSVELAARDVVVAGLRRVRFSVLSTELQKGVGSDLWGRAVTADGEPYDVRVEVKGLSGANPWAAALTTAERDAAVRAAATGQPWWLVIVTHALHPTPTQRWLDAAETAAIFRVPAGPGRWSADRSRIP